MKAEDLIKEINGLIGAIDGKTLERVRSLIQQVKLYQWSLGQINNLWEHSNKLYATRVKDDVLEKLQGELNRLDAQLKSN